MSPLLLLWWLIFVVFVLSLIYCDLMAWWKVTVTSVAFYPKFKLSATSVKCHTAWKRRWAPHHSNLALQLQRIQETTQHTKFLQGRVHSTYSHTTVRWIYEKWWMTIFQAYSYIFNQRISTPNCGLCSANIVFHETGMLVSLGEVVPDSMHWADLVNVKTLIFPHRP